jgi:N-acetylglucosamine kinase-like BadF-type ATPase
MDYLLTDQGSGYEIGRAVLRSAVKSYDGRMAKTVLEHLVCEHFRIASISELKHAVYNPPLTKMEIAELAKIAEQAFNQGDQVAKGIFEHTVQELFEMVVTVIQRLEIKDTPVDVVFVGGVSRIPFIVEQLTQQLNQFSSKITIIRPDKEPVYGALKMVTRL